MNSPILIVNTPKVQNRTEQRRTAQYRGSGTYLFSKASFSDTVMFSAWAITLSWAHLVDASAKAAFSLSRSAARARSFETESS